MDRDKFKQQMKAAMDQAADRLAAEAPDALEDMAEMDQVVETLADQASEALEDMASMERKIYAACDAVKAKYLQAWIDNAGEKGPRPVCPQCRGSLRQKEKVKKTSAAVGGQVEVARTRWWCNACQASFFPSGPDDHGGLLPDHA